jgi:hypothetical protein
VVKVGFKRILLAKEKRERERERERREGKKASEVK